MYDQLDSFKYLYCSCARPPRWHGSSKKRAQAWSICLYQPQRSQKVFEGRDPMYHLLQLGGRDQDPSQYGKQMEPIRCLLRSGKSFLVMKISGNRQWQRAHLCTALRADNLTGIAISFDSMMLMVASRYCPIDDRGRCWANWLANTKPRPCRKGYSKSC